MDEDDETEDEEHLTVQRRRLWRVKFTSFACNPAEGLKKTAALFNLYPLKHWNYSNY